MGNDDRARTRRGPSKIPIGFELGIPYFTPMDHRSDDKDDHRHHLRRVEGLTFPFPLGSYSCHLHVKIAQPASGGHSHGRQLD